ncbi:UbiD family decarboxylase [Paenibacillus sp. NFR01]|uniref:UbiD family decarboxylase n=1 Tax=Paenibacillus sp. NFR01 TaxID=1566279 RepID=UPI0008B4478E|nr:UbiD family decarboxylase [Paenibacillus sp. NFR01]SEU19838.1 UbiD family decarboxylase [Paenibacillus sp. NFR01]
MGYDNLRQWIEELRKDKDLAIIETPVDPYLELAEIHRRVVQEEGPALLFTQVKGTPFPVATNLFGSVRRVNKAFGTRPEQLVKSLLDAAEQLLPPTFGGAWKEKNLLFNLLKVGYKNVPEGEAPVLGICRSSEPLKELPRITSWAEDGGPFITLPLVYTESILRPKDHNLGMYRMQIFDDSTSGMHWQIQKGGGFHHREAELLGETLPVSVFLGGPPALIAAAAAPVPERLPELMLASLIMNSRLPLVKDPLGGHRIPAEAEFAIRGLVPPLERRAEGPFGDRYGYYTRQHDFPLMHVQRMWHRKDAIFPATILGKPRQEDFYLRDYLQRLLSPAYPLFMPSVKALWTYSESGSQALTAAVVRESYSREALVSAFRILGEGQLSLTKCLLLTSELTELSDVSKVLETVLERFRPESDLLILSNTSHDTLDYTGERLNHGSKAVLLGVGDPVRDLPEAYSEGDLPGIRQIKPFTRGCLVVSGTAYDADPDLGQRLVAALRERQTEWPLIFIVDDAEETVRSQTSFLWTVFTRFNPAGDIHADYSVNGHRLVYRLPLVIDARMKPGYPKEVAACGETVRLVDRNWKQYFSG